MYFPNSLLYFLNSTSVCPFYYWQRTSKSIPFFWMSLGSFCVLIQYLLLFLGRWASLVTLRGPKVMSCAGHRPSYCIDYSYVLEMLAMYWIATVAWRHRFLRWYFRNVSFSIAVIGATSQSASFLVASLARISSSTYWASYCQRLNVIAISREPVQMGCYFPLSASTTNRGLRLCS